MNVEELTRDRSALSLVEANREIDKLLRGGVKVTIPDRERGGKRTEVVRVVDCEFLPVHEGGFSGISQKSRRIWENGVSPTGENGQSSENGAHVHGRSLVRGDREHGDFVNNSLQSVREIKVFTASVNI